jgi:NADH-quinone oxidoreductase subunit M
VIYGEVNPEVRHHIFDLLPSEWAVVIPLTVMMVWMGVYPQSFLPPVGRVNDAILRQSEMNVPVRVALPARVEAARAR